MDQKKNDQTVFRCKYCGNVINPDNMFCSSCGAPITSMSRPNQNPSKKDPSEDSLNRTPLPKTSGDIDDLPVINTDEIFKDLDYSSHINTEFEKKQEEELPVIDVDGLFDDVPFADTSNYQNTAHQYYNMNVLKAQPVNQPKVEKEVQAEVPLQEQRPAAQEQRPPIAENKNVQRNHVVEKPSGPRSERPPIKPPTPPVERRSEEAELPPKRKKKKKKVLLFVLLAVVAAVLLWFFVFRKGSSSADLLDLCTVKYTGVNGNGNIELTFNERCDLYDNFAVVDNQEACEELKKITFIATPNTGLSNGDSVTIRADYSNANLNKYHIKVKNDTKQVVVSGLENSATYDLFSGITVTFEGYEGSGKAVLDTSRCDAFAKANVMYSIEGNSENLKNGETIVVKAEVDDSVLEENHYSVEVKQKDYIVGGLLGAQEYDVFKNISVKYSGASPKLSLSIDTSSCDSFVKNNVEFSLSESEKVAIGDKITIEAKFDEKDAEKQGYKIQSKTKTFTVNNVSSYLTSVKGSQSQTLTDVLTSYLSDNKNKNGNSYIFDQDLDELFDDGNSYTFTSAKDEVAGRYFLYDEDKNEDTFNSFILLLKYTVSAQCVETGETKEAVIYAESSVTNLYLAGDQKTLKYDSPSEIVTDTELNYFIDEINGSGYSVAKLK